MLASMESTLLAGFGSGVDAGAMSCSPYRLPVKPLIQSLRAKHMMLVDDHFSLVPGALYLLAGRPAMGHHAFAARLARKMIYSDHSVIWIAAEHSSHWWNSVSNFTPELIDHVVFDDTLLHTPQTLPSCIHRASSRAASAGLPQVGLVIVDSVQSIVEKGECWRSKPHTGLAALRKISQKINVPVIALSSLPRKIERRKCKWPRLNDIRNQAAHELADGVVFLYREGVYEPESNQADWVFVHVAKNRHGLTGGYSLQVADLFTEKQTDSDLGVVDPLSLTP